MTCTSCGWPVAEAELLSSHRTSEGVVRYRRCACGRLLVEVCGVEVGGTRHTLAFAENLPAPPVDVDDGTRSRTRG